MNEQLKEALRLFELIGSDSSRIAKEQYLRSGENNEAFKKLLKATYDPFIMYNIKIFDPDKYPIPESETLSDKLTYFEFLLEALHQRTITGGEAIAKVEDTFGKFNADERLWLSRVIRKDLNIGIKAKTINTVFPGLIPEFSVMLAKNLKSYPRNFIMQPKLDGLRISANTSTGELRSRNGKTIDGYTDIENALKKLPGGLMIDGEILADNFNSTVSVSFTHTNNKIGILNIFDAVPMEAFESLEYDSTQVERTRNLEGIMLRFAAEHPDITCLKLVETSDIISTKEPDWETRVARYYEAKLAQGYEGIMIKDATAPYVCKRSTAWQKVKPVNSYDVPVIGIEAGDIDTEFEEQVGKLVCKYGDQELRVGSGLTKEQRKLWWDNPSLIVGKTIEILAQEETSNRKGTHSLRFPRFKCVRLDK